MVTDTRPQDTHGVDSSRGDLDDACQAPEAVQPTRRPYSPPKLRSLGKVAELTFKAGSQSESTHTSKPGGTH
jgi:hypothetical protein